MEDEIELTPEEKALRSVTFRLRIAGNDVVDVDLLTIKHQAQMAGTAGKVFFSGDLSAMLIFDGIGGAV